MCSDSASVSSEFVPWEIAWQTALYGPGGFYRRPEGPAGHFRTASHAAPGALAAALTRLAELSGCTAIVDVGAGRGELLLALAAEPGAAALRLHGVDVVARPPGLPTFVGWSQASGAADDASLDGALVVAWELLDVVPCPVLEVDGAGAARVVEVDPATGQERLGGRAPSLDAAWCERWWPLDGATAGARAEVGNGRDALWVALVTRALRTTRGAVLLAVDYAHLAADRPRDGSLSGFRAGRSAHPVPDGTYDVTAHVALDAVAAAGLDAGATGGLLVRQREVLQWLGVSGRVPPVPAGTSATEILAGLARAAQSAELLDLGGLGGFTWLLQGAGRELPTLFS